MLIKTKIQIYGCPIWVEVCDVPGLRASQHAEYLVSQVSEAIGHAMRTAHPNTWVATDPKEPGT